MFFKISRTFSLDKKVAVYNPDDNPIAGYDFGRGAAPDLVDLDNDGDQDIFLVDLKGNLKLLRNDGGNANHHLKIKLVGLKTGSGKNNHFGIGATVEVRAGDLYQKKQISK